MIVGFLALAVIAFLLVFALWFKDIIVSYIPLPSTETEMVI